MNKLIIIGSGGHAKVLINILQTYTKNEIVGILDANTSLHNKEVLGVKVLGPDEEITNHPANKVQLVNGIGSIDVPKQRKFIFNKFKTMGYQFFSVIHPFSHIAKDAVLGEGVQIMAGSIIQPGCCIGNNVIVNTRVTIDHDCHINEHVHLAPGAILSGNISIGDGSHIGTGAVIVQSITLGKDCLVGAGAVVIRDVPKKSRVAGVPAKTMK